MCLLTLHLAWPALSPTSLTRLLELCPILLARHGTIAPFPELCITRASAGCRKATSPANSGRRARYRKPFQSVDMPSTVTRLHPTPPLQHFLSASLLTPGRPSHYAYLSGCCLGSSLIWRTRFDFSSGSAFATGVFRLLTWSLAALPHCVTYYLFALDCYVPDQLRNPVNPGAGARWL